MKLGSRRPKTKVPSSSELKEVVLGRFIMILKISRLALEMIIPFFIIQESIL